MQSGLRHDHRIAADASGGMLPSGALLGILVLLVEANDFDRMVAQRFLNSAGVNVDVAESSEAAIALVSAHRYEAVLIDMQMPVMDGITVTGKIRKLAAGEKLPILGLIASSEKSAPARCLAGGMDDVVTKPFDRAALLMALAKWIKPDGSDIAIGQVSTKSNQKLSPIDGLEVEAALTRVSGNVTLFTYILRQFVKSEADTPLQLKAALNRGDLARSQRLMHTLKGLAGTIGATQIQGIAANIERLLQEQGTHAAGMPALQAVLQVQLANQIAAICKSLPREVAAAVCASFDSGESEEVRRELAGLLASDDWGAVKLVQQRAACLRNLLGDRFPHLESAIDRFDFEQALVLLGSGES